MSAARAPAAWPAIVAVGGNHDALRLEPRLALAVRPRAALRRLKIDGTVHRVEFGQVRQASLVELHRGDGADSRDELSCRDTRAASLQLRHRVGNGEHVLERRVPPGPVADEDDVVVGVDDVQE